jgi:ubiquinone/menaquinone biosynthesis C-methylase UbiE
MMDKKQKTIQTYNNQVAQFVDKFNSIGALVEDVKLAFSHIHVSNPNVLEIGCGNGRDAKEIVKYTKDYLGMDASEKLIDEARKKTPSTKFEVADFENFEFPINLDIIFAFASLLHADKDNFKKILEQAYEALNVNGIFFISLMNGNYHELTKNEVNDQRTFYYYTPAEVERLTTLPFKNIYTDYRNLKGKRWFVIILQKFL